jgi:hypothetical protein
MYTLQGKPNQHATHFPRSVCIWLTTIRISRGPHIATFHAVIYRFEQIHCTREEGLLTQSTASLPQTAKEQWGKVNSCGQLTTRLTGPISPACDRYVQYLLAGANRTVLNRHRRGLQPSRCRLATYPLPDLPNQLSPLSPNGSARSLF